MPFQVISKDNTVEQITEEFQKEISQITDKKELQQAFNNGLIELYQEVFSEPPYNEVFETSEVKNIFIDYLNQNGLVFIAKDQDQIIGFSAAMPIAQSSVKEAAQINNLPESSWYIADLGIINSLRRQKLGTQLIESLLQSLPKKTLAVMRTAEKNYPSQNLFSQLGFKKLNFTQAVSQTRTDGQEQADVRIFLAKQL